MPYRFMFNKIYNKNHLLNYNHFVIYIITHEDVYMYVYCIKIIIVFIQVYRKDLLCVVGRIF